MPDERYEPEAAPADAPVVKRGDMTEYTYPAQLKQCEKVLSDRAFGESGKATQWYLVFERADRKWSDGNPVEARLRLVLAWGDGAPVRKGSDADIVAENNEQVFGNSLLPDEGGAQFIGHWFKLKDVESRSSVRRRTDEKAKNYDPDAKPFYLVMVAEHIGESFEYTGSVRTVQSSRGGNSAATPASDPEADDATAKEIAGLLSGASEEDIRGGGGIALVSGVKAQSIYGGSIKGKLYGPSKAPLLDTLIEKGFLAIKDGMLEEVE